MAWDDTLALINTAGFGAFGRAVTYTPPTPPGGADVITVGVFREVPASLQFDDSALSSIDSRLDLRRGAVPGGPVTGARVIVRGTTYEVVDVEGPTDGDVCRLVLKRL